jgi:hypothetical protein
LDYWYLTPFSTRLGYIDRGSQLYKDRVTH